MAILGLRYFLVGFIPQTLCGDGDPLDVLIMGDPVEPGMLSVWVPRRFMQLLSTFTIWRFVLALRLGAVVDVRPIGHMVMEDEKGMDEKVLLLRRITTLF